jgi:preprotein translocase subunit SecD
MILETGSDDAGREEARRIEAILRSGALPIKVDIVGSYDVSAALGEDFGKAAITAGLLAFLGVSAVIYTRYRRLELVVPVLITGSSEIIIIFGIASLIRWDIDLPAIAGIIAAVGTGMDNQIVILDEILLEKEKSIRYRIKNAFFIVMGSWMTLVAAMVPLFVVGFGLLQGFAVTTMIGATAGVFITRPAFARMIQYLIK